MANQTYTYEQLLEKLVRAKVRLEDTRMAHADRCVTELDPYGGPCTCGADRFNVAMGAALRELKL